MEDLLIPKYHIITLFLVESVVKIPTPVRICISVVFGVPAWPIAREASCRARPDRCGRNERGTVVVGFFMGQHTGDEPYQGSRWFWRLHERRRLCRSRRRCGSRLFSGSRRLYWHQRGQGGRFGSMRRRVGLCWSGRGLSSAAFTVVVCWHGSSRALGFDVVPAIAFLTICGQVVLFAGFFILSRRHVGEKEDMIRAARVSPADRRCKVP